MTRRDDLRRVDQSLARLARMATGREGARLRAERSGVFLSQPALAILAASRGAGAVRLSELSRLTGLEPALISREVRELTATGHAERRADPSDGRAGIVALTPKGRRASEAYRAAADEIMAEVLSSWSAADLHALAGHLERVVRDFSRPSHTTVARLSG
ncbi:MAG TPA: MarR family transcriptional regulator [Acidimicrobiia bacterium]|nr:MarR family transcriptional regulator [Acidimicrobiia bacterium]